MSDVIESGCYIDGSHWSAIDLNLEIIWFAQREGWQLPDDEVAANAIDLQWTSEVADEAVEWLNDNVQCPECEGNYWYIYDNSLFYGNDGEDD